jgi:hypothetical protein
MDASSIRTAWKCLVVSFFQLAGMIDTVDLALVPAYILRSRSLASGNHKIVAKNLNGIKYGNHMNDKMWQF